MKGKRFQATVIGNSVATEKQSEVAFQVGRLLGRLGIVVISGGRGGVMEAAAKGVQHEGGLSVGILPGDSIDDSNQFNTIVIPTGIGFARNSMNVLAGDFIIAIGGGAGTLSEIAYAWVYNRPVFCYDGEDGWAKELARKQLDDKFDKPLESFHSIQELEQKLQDFL